MYTAIDLFAGAGGLSLGFSQTGAFDIVLAAENNPEAQQTYKRNQKGTVVEGDVRKLNYSEIAKKYGGIDVVIGGPPCQGFSNANRQKGLLSANNGLVKEYVRAIVELRPKVFLMENVSALKSEVHRFYVEEGKEQEIADFGLTCKDGLIELVEDFPELNRMQAEIQRALPHYADYLWDAKFAKNIHIMAKKAGDNEKLMDGLVKYRAPLVRYAENEDRCRPVGEIGDAYEVLFTRLVEYFAGNCTLEVLRESIMLCDRLQKLFKNLAELRENNVKIEGYQWKKGVCAKAKSYSVLDYIVKTFEREDLPYQLNYQVVNAVQYGAPQKRERFIMLGSRVGEAPDFPEPLITDAEKYQTVRDAISDLEEIEPSIEPKEEGVPLKSIDLTGKPLLRTLRDSSELHNHFRTNTGKNAQERYDELSEGQNFHDLPDTMKTTYADGKRTQSTIYTKLTYDQPSGTVLNVRKSMWNHPALCRAISAREAARLQTFPDSFVFEGSKNSQYQQIGNAVPPMLAKAVGTALALYLNQHDDKLSYREKAIIELIADPYIKQADLVNILGCTQGRVSQIMSELRKNGLLQDTNDETGRSCWKIDLKKLNADGDATTSRIEDLS